MSKFGVIGAGHLAGYTIAALRKGGFAGDISLSPRGATAASKLAAKHQCVVEQTNQAVADAADIILLAVRPADWQTAVKSVEWVPRHVLLSAVSGVSLAQLKDAARIDNVVRIMPSSFIEHGNPFIPAFPANERVSKLFVQACPIVSLESEQQLNDSMIMSCAYAWQFGLMQQMQTWFEDRGWESSVARDMVMRHWRGAVDAANACPQHNFDELLNSIASPGTFTKLGFDELTAQGGDHALRSALAKVAEELDGQT